MYIVGVVYIIIKINMFIYTHHIYIYICVCVRVFDQCLKYWGWLGFMGLNGYNYYGVIQLVSHVVLECSGISLLALSTPEVCWDMYHGTSPKTGLGQGGAHQERCELLLFQLMISSTLEVYLSQMLHVWYIYLQNWAIFGVNVGIHIPAPWFASGYRKRMCSEDSPAQRGINGACARVRRH